MTKKYGGIKQCLQLQTEYLNERNPLVKRDIADILYKTGMERRNFLYGQLNEISLKLEKTKGKRDAREEQYTLLFESRSLEIKIERAETALETFRQMNENLNT